MGRGRLAYVIPLTLGVLAGWGESVALHDGVLYFRSPDPWLRACAYAAVFCMAYGLLWALMRGGLPRPARLTDVMRLLRDATLSIGAAIRTFPLLRGPLAVARRHPVACGGLLMWLCWLPYACLLYPGILWADTSTQLEIVYAPWKAGVDSGAVNDHHPFMDTLLFGAFSDLGARLGSAQAGLFALVLLLGLLQCLALTRLAVAARRWGASRGGVLAAWWFLCLFPFCPVIFASLVKDTVFTVAFTWFLCVFLELLAPHDDAAATAGNDATSPPPSGWRLGVELVAAVVAMCLSKKLGVYVAAGSLLAAVCVLPSARRKAWAVGAAATGVLVAQVVMPVLVLPALHVYKGDSTDVFSVQIQQAARLAHDGRLDAEGRDMVRRSLGIDAEELASRYMWYNVDPAKGSLLAADFDAKAFLTWSVRQAARYPVESLASWLGVEQGWLSLRTSGDANAVVAGHADDSNLLQPLFASAGLVAAQDRGEIEDATTPGGHRVSDWYRLLADAPVVGLVFSKMLWASMLPGYLLFAAWRSVRRRPLMLAMVSPGVLSFLFLFVSPLSISPESTRYVLPLVMTVPFLLAATGVGARRGDDEAEHTAPPRHARGRRLD